MTIATATLSHEQLLSHSADLELRVAWLDELCRLRGNLLKARATEVSRLTDQVAMLARRCAEQAHEMVALLQRNAELAGKPSASPDPVFAAIGVHQRQGVR